MVQGMYQRVKSLKSGPIGQIDKVQWLLQTLNKEKSFVLGQKNNLVKIGFPV